MLRQTGYGKIHSYWYNYFNMSSERQSTRKPTIWYRDFDRDHEILELYPAAGQALENLGIEEELVPRQGWTIFLNNDNEDKDKIPQFSTAARRALENLGFEIYTLGGDSIETQMEKGLPLWKESEIIFEDGEVLKHISNKREVAIHPKKFLFSESNKKTFLDQEYLIEAANRLLAEKAQPFRLEIGEITDYAGLFDQHEKSITSFWQSKDLLPNRFNFSDWNFSTYLRTNTEVRQNGGPVNALACRIWGKSTHINEDNNSTINDGIYIAPLLVPYTVEVPGTD